MSEAALKELERLYHIWLISEDEDDTAMFAEAAGRHFHLIRAALSPVGDGEIEAIRGRHEAALARMADNNWPMSEGRQDVATLLAMVEKMRSAQ